MSAKKGTADFLVFLPQKIIAIPQDSNLSWLTLFYALPRELVKKRPAYLELPRKPYSILRTHDYDRLLMDDAFLELFWSFSGAFLELFWSFSGACLGLLCVDGVAVFQGAGSARRAS